jgi:hypothetical protein
MTTAAVRAICVSARGPDADRRGKYMILLNSTGSRNRADLQSWTSRTHTTLPLTTAMAAAVTGQALGCEGADWAAANISGQRVAGG